MKKNKISETEKALQQEAAVFMASVCSPFSKEVLRQLTGCKNLVFVGTGSSHHVAEWAASFFKENTTDHSLAFSTWDALFDLSLYKHFPPHTLVVVISHRGYSGFTKLYVDRLKKTHRRFLLLCAEGAPTGGHAHLYVSPKETSKAHSMSLLGAMGAVMALALRSRDKSKKIVDHALQTAAAVENITHGPEIKSFLQKKTRLHVVGGGPFHAIAREIALKAQEMAHIPALAHNIEAILHGPLTAVEEDDAVLLLPAITKAYPFLYTSRIAAVKKAAEQVGALVVEPHFSPQIKAVLKQLPLSFQAIAVLAWGQKFALSHAVSHGIDPDSNRFEDSRYKQAARTASL